MATRKMIRRIVITGGPGTGKTALIRHLEQLGYPCFHEVIREMTLQARKDHAHMTQQSNPLAFVDDPMAFNRRILKGRVDQFHAATGMQEPFVFYDRGLPDIIAYMDYFGQDYQADFTGPCRDLRYDTVVLLPPWKEIYTQDEQRLETFEEACDLHKCLETSYLACGYHVEQLAFGAVADRVAGLLQIIGGDDGRPL